MQGRSTRARRSDVGTPPEPLFRPQSPRRLANGAAGGRRPRGVCSPAEGGAPVGPPPPSFLEARAVRQSLRRRSSPRTVLGFVLPRALPPLQRRLRWRGRRFPPPRTSFGPQAADARVSRNPQATHTRPHHPTIHATTPTVLLFAGAAPCARLPFVLFYFVLPSPFHRHGLPWVSAGSAGLVDIACLSSPPRRRVPFPIATVAARPGSHRHGAFAARIGPAAATPPVFPSRSLPLLGRSRQPVEPPRPPRPPRPAPPSLSRLCLVTMEHPAVVGLGSAALPLRGVAEVPPRRAGCSASAGLGGGPPPPGVAKAGGVAGAGVRRVSPAAPPRSPRPSARGRAGDRPRRQLACPTPRRAMPASTLVGGMYVDLFPNVLFLCGGPRPRML